MDQLTPEVLNWVVGIITAALVALSGTIITYVNAKANSIKATSKNEKVNHYIDKAAWVIDDVVKAANQTVVADLKKASADGKLTDDEKKDILDNAVATVFTTLSTDAWDVLKEVFGDADGWVRNRIESCVAMGKMYNPVPCIPISGEPITPVQPIENVVAPLKPLACDVIAKDDEQITITPQSPFVGVESAPTPPVADISAPQVEVTNLKSVMTTDAPSSEFTANAVDKFLEDPAK